MYVGGRGSGTDGTVLPTLMQAQIDGQIGDIHVAATNAESISVLQIKLAELNSRLGSQVKIIGYPSENLSDPLAYKKALKTLPRPAAAIVVVPDHLHHEITTEVLRAGVHSLVVKPFTPTVREARDLIKIAEDQDLYGAVEFHKRFDETNLLLRQAIKDGRLGELRYITVEYSQRRMMQQVFSSWVTDTNIFQYLGVHYVDLIYFLTGARPIRLVATGQPNTDDTFEIPGKDSIQALIEWEESSGNRFVSSIVTNWIDPDITSAMSDQKITVVGLNGRYQIDQKHRGAELVTESGGIDDVNPYFSQIYVGGQGKIRVHGYGPRCITQFLTEVENVTSGQIERNVLINNRPTFLDCLPSTAVIEAVNKSLVENSAWIQVEDVGSGAQSE